MHHGCVESWQAIGTVTAVVFGAIGTTVAVIKLVWERPPQPDPVKEAEEAARRAHEAERRSREEARWHDLDQEAGDRGFRTYSEAEAREFLRSQPTMALPPERSAARRGVAIVSALLVAALAVGIVWLLSR